MRQTPGVNHQDDSIGNDTAQSEIAKNQPRKQIQLYCLSLWSDGTGRHGRGCCLFVRLKIFKLKASFFAFSACL